ncbi:NYN domain-containing protein, partial [bacterium]|nr:NYN domain-containing protein [bacterium]
MNKTNQEKNLALFIDFDNIALGLRASRRKRFDVRLILERLLEKGKIIVKKAYADWSHFTEYKEKLHAAGIELIDIPKR